MSTEKFQNKYRIPSARAVWHDYNGGIYFITICTKNREYYFGEIIPNNNKQQMILSEIGIITDDCIQKMETLHNDITVSLYQIMPNHIHFIVMLRTNNDCRDDVSHRLNNTNDCGDDVIHRLYEEPEQRWKSSIVNEEMQQISRCRGRLSYVIGGFKRAVTKYANENNLDFAWQPRFHDHIVRDQDELNDIAYYIENNVARWDKDYFNNNCNNGDKHKTM